MQAWYFTEMPYPHLPPANEISTMRVSLPVRHFDPKIGADLYNRYLDEHMIADDAGLNMLVNEHHQTATCLDVAAPLSLAILARQTSKGRICILGNPIANRGDPIRIAEEMAMVDCISRGRVEAGFVRGVPYEVFAANTVPSRTAERLWEGIDLVQKAWTSHDEPFNFEGAFTHRRAVNVWPRPYQQPHPPIWVTGSSDLVAIRRAASRGFVFATFLQPHAKVRQLFDAYRQTYALNGQHGGGGTAFMPLVYVADTESEAEAGMKELICTCRRRPRFSIAIRRATRRWKPTCRGSRAHFPAAPTPGARKASSFSASRASSCTARRIRSWRRSGVSMISSAVSITC